MVDLSNGYGYVAFRVLPHLRMYGNIIHMKNYIRHMFVHSFKFNDYTLVDGVTSIYPSH